MGDRERECAGRDGRSRQRADWLQLDVFWRGVVWFHGCVCVCMSVCLLSLCISLYISVCISLSVCFCMSISVSGLCLSDQSLRLCLTLSLPLSDSVRLCPTLSLPCLPLSLSVLAPYAGAGADRPPGDILYTCNYARCTEQRD